MRDFGAKSDDGQADEQREKPVQGLPTPFRKTRLSPKLLEFQRQKKLFSGSAHPFPRQPTFKGVFSVDFRPIKWKTTIHSCRFLILTTPSFGEMNKENPLGLDGTNQMLLILSQPLQH